jgi:hypothetical protein
MRVQHVGPEREQHLRHGGRALGLPLAVPGLDPDGPSIDPPEIGEGLPEVLDTARWRCLRARVEDGDEGGGACASACGRFRPPPPAPGRTATRASHASATLGRRTFGPKRGRSVTEYWREVPRRLSRGGGVPGLAARVVDLGLGRRNIPAGAVRSRAPSCGPGAPPSRTRAGHSIT